MNRVSPAYYLLLPLLVGMLGACGIPAVLWSDPYFELTQTKELNRDLRTAAKAVGFKLRIRQLPLEGDYYNLIVEQTEGQEQEVIVLSPLLFREAVILAENFPDHFIALLDDRVERQPDNLAIVTFEREETMRALGMRIAELLGTDDRALIFFLNEGEQRSAELTALELGFEPAQERIDLITVQPNTNTENLTAQFQSNADEQLRILGLLLGSQQPLGRSIASMTDATLVLENIGGAAFYTDRARISIENDYPAALQAILLEFQKDLGQKSFRVPAQLVE